MPRRRGGIASPQLSAISQHADQIRARLVAAQKAAAEKVVEGSSSDSLVTVALYGDMRVKSVSIDPAAVEDPPQLEAKVEEALRNAVSAVSQLRSGSTGGVDLSSINLGGAPITG